MTAQPRLAYDSFSDLDLARLAAEGDQTAVALITRRNNRRLYRAAWSILRNDADAQDAVQSAYLKAFRAIGNFDARSSLSTWLTRIAINEALTGKRQVDRRQLQLTAENVASLRHTGSGL